jgi:hypothetical protein
MRYATETKLTTFGRLPILTVELMNLRTHRLVAVATVAAMLLSGSPLFAAGPAAPQAQGATISGTAMTASGAPIPHALVQLRDLATNRILATTRTSGTGEFIFSGVPAGVYVVELVDDDGNIIAASATLSVTAGAAVTGLAIATVATFAVAAGSSAMATAAIVATSAAAAGVAATTAIASSASPSR